MIIFPTRDQKIWRLTDGFSFDSVHLASDSTGFTTKHAVKRKAVEGRIEKRYATSMML